MKLSRESAQKFARLFEAAAEGAEIEVLCPPDCENGPVKWEPLMGTAMVLTFPGDYRAVPAMDAVAPAREPARKPSPDANPYPPEDWRREMWKAWRDGELQILEHGEWEDFGVFIPPGFNCSRDDYRRRPRPEPVAGPWDAETFPYADVPFGVRIKDKEDLQFVTCLQAAGEEYVWLANRSPSRLTHAELFRNWTRLDGSPCGVVKGGA